MKKRIRLISKGKVQKVEYRDAVKDIASKSGVTGYVENMRNSDVQIVCELDEELIPKFVEAIKIKKDFINVEDVKIVEKSNATGEFEYFDIKYGRLEEEFGDRAGTMVLYLGGIQSSVNGVQGSVNKVGEKVDNLRDETHESFNKMDKKYDVIFKTMVTMNKNLLAGQKQFTILNKNLANTQVQFTKVVDRLTFIVDRFIENEKNKSKNDTEVKKHVRKK
ncbi:MAG: acylphosphatase [Thermoplasmatales archaeon]|nr:acylphosphatase [Thermoplasmatales archaeon]